MLAAVDQAYPWHIYMHLFVSPDTSKVICSAAAAAAAACWAKVGVPAYLRWCSTAAAAAYQQPLQQPANPLHCCCLASACCICCAATRPVHTTTAFMLLLLQAWQGLWPQLAPELLLQRCECRAVCCCELLS
jgi:hypothetical protein